MPETEGLQGPPPSSSSIPSPRRPTRICSRMSRTVTHTCSISGRSAAVRSAAVVGGAVVVCVHALPLPSMASATIATRMRRTIFPPPVDLIDATIAWPTPAGERLRTSPAKQLKLREWSRRSCARPLLARSCPSSGAARAKIFRARQGIDSTAASVNLYTKRSACGRSGRRNCWTGLIKRCMRFVSIAELARPPVCIRRAGFFMIGALSASSPGQSRATARTSCATRRSACQAFRASLKGCDVRIISHCHSRPNNA